MTVIMTGGGAAGLNPSPGPTKTRVHGGADPAVPETSLHRPRRKSAGLAGGGPADETPPAVLLGVVVSRTIRVRGALSAAGPVPSEGMTRRDPHRVKGREEETKCLSHGPQKTATS